MITDLIMTGCSMLVGVLIGKAIVALVLTGRGRP